MPRKTEHEKQIDKLNSRQKRLYEALASVDFSDNPKPEDQDQDDYSERLELWQDRLADDFYTALRIYMQSEKEPFFMLHLMKAIGDRIDLTD